MLPFVFFSAMVRSVFFLLLCGIAGTQQVQAQELRKWESSVALESYLFERYDGPGPYLNADYAGQTFSGRFAYTSGQHWQFGVSGGLYFHHRQGGNNYLFLPLQGFVTYRTASDRFRAEFSTGYPLRLYESNRFIGQQGYWYKDIEPSELETTWIRQHVFLMSHLRLKFRMSNALYFTTGIRHSFYSYYSLNTPDNLRTPRNYFNLSFGLEYRFGQKKK